MELFYTTVLQHHIKTAFANNFDSSSLRDLNSWQIEWRGAEKGICRWKLSLAVLFKTCVNVVKLVNLILHMSRYFLAVKVSDGSVYTGQSLANSILPFLWDDPSGMPEAVPSFFLTAAVKSISSLCFSVGFRQGRKREISDLVAEQMRTDGCGKPGIGGSPGMRGKGGLWISWKAADRGSDSSREQLILGIPLWLRKWAIARSEESFKSTRGSMT